MKQALSPETPARVRRQFRAITLGIGASAFAMACSFGEIDNEEPIVPIAPVPAEEAPGPDTAAPDDTTIPGGSTASPGDGTNNTPPAPDGTTMGPRPIDTEDPFQSPIGLEVKEILTANCGGCHISPAQNGDVDYILDINALIDNEKVVPGQKEDSPLFVRMQQQSMPPAFIREQRPTFQQIDLVGQFIDEMEPIESQQCDALPFMSSDEQIELMARDAASLDDDDALFTRYLTITYNLNAGGCGRELERQRFALFKTINSVSTNPTIGNPQPIDENQTIFRIDLRDYNFDRQIDLLDDGTIIFNDAWDAILADPNAAPYAIEYAGNEADALKEDTGTAVPFLAVNAFIQAAEQGELYYALIGAKQNLFDFELEVLGIDTAAEIEDGNFLRAGFANSGVSKQERVLNRFDSGFGLGSSYWISFDFDGGNGNGDFNIANESIFADPLGFAFAGGEAIFNLPNGLQAYYVADAAGNRLAEAPVGVVIDPAQNNGVVTNGSSCNSCHNAGMISFEDQVRRYVEANRVLFDNQTFEDVLEVYPPVAEFNRVMAADSEVHIRAVEATGVPRKAADPISRVFLDFQLGNITARYAAGELNTTVEDLQRNIALLDPTLQPLLEENGYVDRDVFTNAYLDAICIMQSSSENTPVGCP